MQWWYITTKDKCKDGNLKKSNKVIMVQCYHWLATSARSWFRRSWDYICSDLHHFVYSSKMSYLENLNWRQLYFTADQSIMNPSTPFTIHLSHPASCCLFTRHYIILAKPSTNPPPNYQHPSTQSTTHPFLSTLFPQQTSLSSSWLNSFPLVYISIHQLSSYL